ncbi:MAG: hypothetical protein ACKVP7_04805 [Hyphomicrobiaceae bacterium]
MTELLWLVRMGFCVWIAWKAVLMLDVGNPLMGIFFAMILMIAGPIGFNMLLESQSDLCSEYGLTDVMSFIPMGAPMAFALMGAFLWSGVEALTGR